MYALLTASLSFTFDKVVPRCLFFKTVTTYTLKAQCLVIFPLNKINQYYHLHYIPRWKLSTIFQIVTKIPRSITKSIIPQIYQIKPWFLCCNQGGLQPLFFPPPNDGDNKLEIYSTLLRSILWKVQVQRLSICSASHPSVHMFCLFPFLFFMFR
jgi:hypothetical protein